MQTCVLHLSLSHGLRQHVRKPTHRARHTLDLAVTRVLEFVVKCIHVSQESLAFRPLLSGGHPTQEHVMTRNCRKLNRIQFQEDLRQCQIELLQCYDLHIAVAQSGSKMANVLDKPAPQRSKTVIVRLNAQWYSDDIHAAKQKRRHLECRWRHTGLEINRQMYCEQRKIVVNLIYEAKLACYRNRVGESDNQRGVFRIVDALMHRPKAFPFPMHTSSSDLADEFCSFFSGKIRCIRNIIASELESATPLVHQLPSSPECTSRLISLAPPTSEEVRKMLERRQAGL